MLQDEISMGKLNLSWNGSDKGTKSITLCVTEDCNLKCKYCYMKGKNNLKKMTFETAKKSVDYILKNKDIFYEGAVVWDFIGGEPFLEIDLIDRICDYIKLQMYILDHPWFEAYRFSFSTNGILYCTDKVQNFIKKNKGHLSIGISVDGNKVKHDLQRVYPNGRGSYEDVVKNVPLWLEQFKGKETKATFSHEDLPYLKDSIINLWNLGIKNVAANVVFEDVWVQGDELILENQLDELGEYILENNLYNDYSVRFFDPSIGHPLEEEDKKKNFCGAGNMLAIDCEGNFYPCIRFLDFSLDKKMGRNIGNIDVGIDKDKIRPFLALNLENQSKKECLECDIASGCAWCTGFNYDNSDDDTIYERATFNCKMHKATVRSNKKFWKKYEKKTGDLSPRREFENPLKKKYMQIILNDKHIPICSYKNVSKQENIISTEIIDLALKFANENDLEIVFIGDITDKISFSSKIKKNSSYIWNKDNMIIYDNNVNTIKKSENSILLIDKFNIENITAYIESLKYKTKRINLILQDIEIWTENELEKYKNELELLVNLITDMNVKNRNLEINVLTDRLYLEKICDCGAGIDTITLAPNGKLYPCPAFYFDDVKSNIGDLIQGINKEKTKYFSLDNAPICKKCDAYHCKRCLYLNKKLTCEYNTPSKMQCLISNYERKYTIKLQRKLIDAGIIENNNLIKELDYMDPLNLISGGNLC
ncbi:hypothetical protein UT300019_18670 [Clostridium sp. CTA-19]